MIKINKLLVLLLLLFAGTTAFAQKDSTVINRNLRALQNYATQNPQEKVHLHLDRQLYFPGDTIWFKAYVALGEYHKLSALSGVLHVELIGPKDTVISRLTPALIAGTAPGDFEIPFDAKPGNYRIRAYTNYMRNDGPSFFYDQRIVIASFSTTVDPLKTAPSGTGPDKVDLQFFPEGGELVNGLRSKVAFKAINQNGFSEEVQGTITDNDGNEVASFTTQHLGMGIFPLLPQKGKQYTAKVTAADGSAFTAPLPPAKDAGFTLSVNNNLPDSLYLKVAANDDLFKARTDTAIYLIAQSGGKYYFAAGRKLADKVFTATIPKNRFPSGIVQFTLFSQSGEPLNERIVFIQNNDQLHLTINSENASSASSENVKFHVEAKAPDGNAAVGTFSVSVVDESRVPVNENAENTIFTDLLLKSELAGEIEDPNYYFNNPNDQTSADLDLLMLTQGYHRFEWKKILAGGTTDVAYKPEKSFTISGTIKTPAGKPIPNGKVMLTSLKNLFVLDTLSDANGRFSFEVNLPDTAKLVINAKKANGGSNVDLTIDKPENVVAGNPSNGNIANHFSGELRPDVEQLRSAYAAWRQDSTGHVIQLKEVNVKERKSTSIRPDYSVLLKHSANLNGAGQADQVIMGDKLLGCPDIATCLPGLLHGGARVTFGAGNIPVVYSTHIPIALHGATKSMAVMIDGVIEDQTALSLISPSDVQSIEMLESPMYFAIYGSQASGGLIVITTKYGDEINAPVTLVPGLSLYRYGGFYKARQFYSPKYTAANPVSKTDMRKTIYWNPAIITGADGRASFNYFNAGKKGVYRVVIEGIDGDGKLGRQVLTYNFTAGE